jgi:hypothetical protein
MRSSELTQAEISFAQFGPGELERITGFPQHLQRLWRRRGHLSAKTPHARSHFSAVEVAELFVRYLLAVYCVSPTESRAIGEKAGPMVLWAALLCCDGACEVLGEREDVERLINAFAHDDGLASSLAGFEGEFTQFLWSGDGSSFEFTKESEPVFASFPHYSYVFLDLEWMGTTLGQRAGKPLVTVRLDAGPQRTIRRLTTGVSREKK